MIWLDANKDPPTPQRHNILEIKKEQQSFKLRFNYSCWIHVTLKENTA